MSNVVKKVIEPKTPLTPKGLDRAGIQQNRLRWVEALESGEFVQGMNSLCHLPPRGSDAEACYCCLGVAGELFHRSGYARKVIAKNEVGDLEACFELLNEDVPDVGEEGDFSFGYLPTALAEALGMDIGLQRRLAEMNDDEDADFREIARYLRELWELPSKLVDE